jgi:hypothetical protein
MEDLSAAIGIKLGYLAGWFFLCESAAQNASGRGASDQVKESARGLPGAPSICCRSRAGMIPLIPPPSILKIRMISSAMIVCPRLS